MHLNEEEQRAFRDFEKAGWEGAAKAYHDHWGNLSWQSAKPMLDAAGVEAGNRVLDLASGAGYVAAAAALRDAVVTGLDFSPAQVALASEEYPGIDFRQGNAEDLPFGDATIDAVVMGFGMNHLPDPDRVAREVFRVLKPGGRFAFTVWADPKDNPAFRIVMGALSSLGDSAVKLPPAPPYFRFADAGLSADFFKSHGFADPATTLVEQYWTHETPDDLYVAFSEGAVRATAMIRAQPEAIREKIKAEVREAVSNLQAGGYYVIPVPAALSVATKPG